MKNPSYSLLTLCVLSFPLAFSVPAESREDMRDAVKRVANDKLAPLDAVTARADRIQDVGKDNFELKQRPARLQENIETGATTDDIQLLQPGKTWTEAKARPEKAATADDIEDVRWQAAPAGRWSGDGAGDLEKDLKAGSPTTLDRFIFAPIGNL